MYADRRAGRGAAPLPRAHSAEDGRGGGELKQRTLTNLYNQRPRWLADAHERWTARSPSAYGWPEDIATDDALQRLLALNLERAAAQSKSNDEGEAG